MSAALIILVLLAVPAPNFETALRAGLQALSENNLATAQFNLEAASKLQPNNAQVLLALSQTYYKQDRRQQADNAATRAELLGGNDPVVLHALAFYYTETKSLDKAASCETRYAEKAPQDEEAYPRAIDLYLRAQNPKQAVVVAQKALIEKGGRGDLHLLLAKSYNAAGQFDKAVPEFKQALALRSFDEGYYFELAQAYLGHEKFKDALELLNTARTRFDKSARIELASGVALYGLRRFPEAIDCLLRTIQINPDVEQPYVFLGRMIDAAGPKLPDLTGALASFASANPGNYLSSFLYAKALAFQNAEPDQLEPLLRKSIKLYPNFWEAHFELAAALEKEKDYQGAAAEYIAAAEMNPKDAATHYRLARVYERLGKPAQAAIERGLHAKLSDPSGAH